MINEQIKQTYFAVDAVFISEEGAIILWKKMYTPPREKLIFLL